MMYFDPTSLCEGILQTLKSNVNMEDVEIKAYKKLTPTDIYATIVASIYDIRGKQLVGVSDPHSFVVTESGMDDYVENVAANLGNLIVEKGLFTGAELDALQSSTSWDPIAVMADIVNEVIQAIADGMEL